MHSACHSLSVPTDEGDPPVGTGAGIDTLGRRGRSSVALTGHEVTVGGVLDDLLDGDVDGHVEHGQLDLLTLTGAPPLLERGEHGEGAVDAGERVADAGQDRWAVGPARDPGHARRLLHRGGEGRPVTPGALEPPAGHAQVDDVRPERHAAGRR